VILVISAFFIFEKFRVSCAPLILSSWMQWEHRAKVFSTVGEYKIVPDHDDRDVINRTDKGEISTLVVKYIFI
jgi:hypothetical protein